MADNYVKFRRGTPAAYDALCKTPDGPDKDTLYFIYEEDELQAELYLGTKLIASSDGDIIGATNLAGLSDVLLSASLNDKEALIYDIAQSKWVNKPIVDVLSAFVGTNGTANGVKGLVPAPLANQANMFLRSDGQWAEIVVASETQVFQTIIGVDEDHNAAILRITQNTAINKGDIVVVKDVIVDNNYQYTSYVYDGSSWVAMDGNYDAENIYLASDLTITADIGVQTLDGAGSKVLNTAGKNLKQVLDMILASRTLPGYANPSVSVSCTDAKSYEVGSTINLTYSATFDDGKYDYDPGEATGVEVTAWSATFNDQTITSQSGSFENVVVTDGFKKRISVTATHGAGVAPEDNLGNIVTDAAELLTCQIQSGTKTGHSNYVTGYRNMFYGSKTNAVELTSDNIRTLSAKAVAKGALEMSVTEGATQVIIAVPSGYTVVKVADKNAFGTDIFEKFVLSTVSVAGAAAGYDKDYNVYVYSPSAALGANTYTVTVQ